MDKYWMEDMLLILYEEDKDEMLASLLAPRIEKLPREDKEYLWQLTYDNQNNRYQCLLAKLRLIVGEK
jgi:hypothetical protein